ncbi:biotin--[acetyl-CoA-carboxylase] ligase [Neptunicoccus sediminis]|uniref:biotin--[acetyl-CoA-carboxylase] ligase n=1 Tax=Neptunicoccus sediminis TaxID=1892596 RepID=UPI000845FB7C|nr:biotin--[acetyl-CoA-carboxylase] ligase [Neptunicoccus sediminis]
MQGWPEGTGKFVFDTIDSTMAEARRQAPATAGAAWFLSHEQTAGSGRRGRPWSSQKGNFAASLLIRPDAAPDKLALRSFVAALALYDALVECTGRSDAFALKWPNDVLLKGGKLAGILLETIAEGPNRYALIIGIGVNLANRPEAGKLEPTALAPKSLKQDMGVSIAPESFLGALAVAYADWETRLQTYGFAPIREAWLARAANIGKPVTARLADRSIEGIFETVDETGALILQAPDRQHVITAADISL